MLRRQALSFLLSAIGTAATKPSPALNAILDPTQGCAILLNLQTRQFTTNSETLAGRTLLAPGSTLKPIVLASLLKRGKLKPDTAYPCPTRLTIGQHRFDCNHPILTIPVRPDTALAYSCNCYVAHMAERFEPGELSHDLEGFGLTSRTGLIPSAEASGTIATSTSLDATRMQAIGEAGVLMTPLELAIAYRQLARNIAAPEMQPILAGLEGAVEYGTAQGARVAGTTVAGKTGTTRSPAGEFIAWFVGFTPSRAPETIIAVMLAGRSGGGDAAPVAAKILEARRAGRV